MRDVFTFSLVAEGSALVAHDPRCPVLREHRAHGGEVFTLIDCRTPLTDAIARHDCLLDDYQPLEED